MILVVEAFRNICGATLLKDGYGDYEEFNLKKFQTTHCSNSSISNLTSFKKKNSDGDKDENSYYKPVDDTTTAIDEKESEVEVELTDTSSSSAPPTSISTSHVVQEEIIPADVAAGNAEPST
jgi:hypothetical protein